MSNLGVAWELRQQSDPLSKIQAGAPPPMASVEPSAAQQKKWSWVIDPREVMWIAYWDIVTTTALVFTSTVTPLEVAFLQPLAPDERWTNGLFLTNRLVDCVFIFDMVCTKLSYTAKKSFLFMRC